MRRDGTPGPGPIGDRMVGSGDARAPVGTDPRRAPGSERTARARAGAARWAERATLGAAWFALCVSLALTAAAWRFADAREEQAERGALQSRASALAGRLSARALAYEQLLRGGAGLFAAAGPVGRAEWHAFVGALGLATLPGVEGIGWSPRVGAGELAAHVEAVRRDGPPDYRVFPADPKVAYAPIAYLEPMAGRNLRAIGFDMLGEPVRRAAMLKARDTGRASLTGRVVLVQEGRQPRQAGFLAYLPVYRPGAPVATVDERRAALAGWVYAAFRAGDFVDGALGGVDDLRYEIRDGRDGAVLHASAAPSTDPPGEGPRRAADAAPLRVPVPMADREWELVARPAAPVAGTSPRGSTVVAIGGGVAGVLVFGIVRMLATTRRRALRLADRMTAALRVANETLESRVRERTASLRETNERLATVNDKLRAVNAAFGAFGAGGPTADRLGGGAQRLRTIVPARVALAVAVRAGAAAGPSIGLDADPTLTDAQRERWHRAAFDSDRSGEPPEAGDGPLTWRLHAPLLDAQGRSRGYLLLGREHGAFAAEDAAVLAQFALLVGTSLSLHETLARERHARAQAERADRAKEEMLAVVSHELRTPLNAIQGWLHVLRRRRADDAALLGRAIEVIQRNLDTQVQLVDDLLDTARIVSGKLRLDLQSLDLAPVLRAAVDTVRPLAEAKRIDLSVDIAPGAFVTVGDASRLEQVVWNLLTNAVKFTPQGGRVSVRLERLGWLAQLEVEDDGQGIDPAFLPHVFDRFRQADSSSTRATGGLGLGLALVQHIVQAHGGQVMVRSDGAGRGAVFTVSLPLGMDGLPDPSSGDGSARVSRRPAAHAWPEASADAPAGGEADDEAGARPLAGLQVLVVEDHDDSRDLLAEFLAAQGATVLPAANAHEAMAQLERLHDRGPAALLCDIALPGENGYALLARVRRYEQARGRPPHARLVAFAVSAFTRAEDRERSLAAGFREHLGKPLSQAEPLQRLARLCEDAGGRTLDDA